MQQRAPPLGCRLLASGTGSSAAASAPESERSSTAAASGFVSVYVMELLLDAVTVDLRVLASAATSVWARAQASTEASAEAQGTALAEV